MYQWGLEGGRPAAGKIGVPPEWFYKLSGFGRPLRNPVRIDRSTQACIRVDQLG